MVVFTCNHCGESLQKPKVEKHYNFACRKAKNLTCVDCFKDFHHEEYALHTKCITEEERYAKKGSIPTGIVKKGDKKQEAWMDMIKKIISEEKNLSKPIRNFFEKMISFSNVPRKKPKFVNFITNSFRRQINPTQIETLWTIIEKYSEGSKEGDQSQLKRKAEENGEEVPEKKIKVESEVKEEENGDEKQDESKEGKKKKKEKKKNKETEKEDNTVKPETETIEDTVKEKKKKKSNETCSEETEVENQEEVKKEKKKKKNKLTELNGNENLENGNELKETKQECNGIIQQNGNKAEFDIKEVVRNVLTEQKSIPFSELQQIVVEAYINHSLNLKKFKKQFKNKLSSMDEIKIVDDNVILES